MIPIQKESKLFKNPIHEEYLKVLNRNENYKIEFFPLMNCYFSNKYKIKITIVASDLRTNARKNYIDAFINAIDLGTVVNMIQKGVFTSEKFYGGGIENGQVVCRIILFEMKDNGSLLIAIQKCPGKQNADGGYVPIGKPVNQMGMYLKGFALQRTLYRLETYINHKMIMDFKKFEYAPPQQQLREG